MKMRTSLLTFLSWALSMSSIGQGYPCFPGSVCQHSRPAVARPKWPQWFLALAVWCMLLLYPCGSHATGLPGNSITGTSALPKRQILLSTRRLQNTKTPTAPAAALRTSGGLTKWDHLGRSGRQTSSRKRQKRVVLSYELKGCPSTRKGAEEEGQLLQGQEASNHTMKLLRDKLSELLATKNSKWAEAVTPVSEISGYGQASESRRVTTELSSRYLSSLQMEVIKTMPTELSEEEVIEIAEALPCVEKAYPDGLKYPDEALRGSTENQAPTPLQRRGSGEGLNENLLDSLMWKLEGHDDPISEGSPDDPGFRLQWSLHDSAPFSLHAEKLWHVWTGEKRPMVVAVIDSGCDLDHPDLRSRAWNNPGEICGDGVDNDENGFVDDCHGWNFADDLPDVSASANGHGTGAAGILGATARNRLGLVGVCWGCEIMCLKFIGKGNGTISDQVQAIDYAVKMGAWISNNSYGGYGFSELEFDAIRRAQIGGHLFITSAGNFNLNTDLPHAHGCLEPWETLVSSVFVLLHLLGDDRNDHTPSTYKLSNIISVGASTYFGKKAAFSNYGTQTVHVFAPGADVYTTDGVSGYAKVNGTSFASPHVAGAAGLIWSAFPNLTYLQVKQALIEGCTKSRHLEGFAHCGGTIDLLASFRLSAKLAARTNAAFPVPSPGLEHPFAEPFTPKDEQASKTRALPAREPEVFSVLGTSDATALTKQNDRHCDLTSGQQSTAGVLGDYAVDSSLGPAISMPAYTSNGKSTVLQSSPFNTIAAAEIFRICADDLPPTSRGLPKVGADCSFLSKFTAVSPSMSRQPDAAVNDTVPVTSVPSSFSLFNDKHLEHAWRAEAGS